jgi:hypothetical protein
MLSWALGLPDGLVLFMADDAGSVGPKRHHSGYADPWPS